jgi:YtxH-like protein
MSYAGPAARGSKVSGMSGLAGSRGGRSTGGRSAVSGRAPNRVPLRPVASEPDKLTVFAGGLALGLLVGGSVALLFAPAAGRDTRRSVARRSKRLRERGSDAWSDLRFEFERMKRRRRHAQRRRRAEQESD